MEIGNRHRPGNDCEVNTVYLANSEAKNLTDWLVEHFKTCVCPDKAGYDVTIKQSNASGIGTTTYVECSCGSKKDITDYSIW